jgi:hypothetical protein
MTFSFPAPPEQTARADGLPLYIGYGGMVVRSPDQAHVTRWEYVTEPPHGDSANQVWLDGRRLPGLYWGRGHAWSPDSAYFTLEQHDYPAYCCPLYVVRAADQRWYKVADHAGPVSLGYPRLRFRAYGNDTPIEELSFSGDEEWLPIG